MYYCAGLTSDSYRNVALQLSPALNYIIEEMVQNPVTLRFSADMGGQITSNITEIRNIPQGRTIAEQMQIRWPEAAPDEGYTFAGWAYTAGGDILVGDTQIGTVNGVYVSEIELVALFRRLVTFRFYEMPGALYTADTQIHGTAFDDDYLIALYAANDGPPTRVGYVFTSWQTLVDENLPIIFDQDTSLAAQWSPKNVHITLLVEDHRLQGDARQIPVLSFDAKVEDNFAALVPSAAELRAFIAPIEDDSDYVFEFYGPTQANGFYTITPTDEAGISIVVARVRRPSPPPHFSNGINISLRYRSTTQLNLVTTAPGTIIWDSSNQNIVTVGRNGSITGLATGMAQITATDSDGFYATCTVTVSYVWWQWLIMLFLFGWLWY